MNSYFNSWEYFNLISFGGVINLKRKYYFGLVFKGLEDPT
jgi:hypothetical protein